ncbi:MAG TPA: acyl-CoA dehydrogenase family protein [Actinomycetota bacterium]|nr:acyl-CoA dehydrogenase family protein [Actinomycetota bacterium]
MDFALTEEQRELQKWGHEFAEREIRPVAPHYDETEEFPWPVLRKAVDIGLYGMDIYMQTQQDPSGLSMAILMEEIFWGCAGIGLGLFGTGLPLSALAAGGTPEQLGTWAPRMFGTPEEPAVASFCVTEPNAGSDVSSLRTKAERVEDGFVLNGQKIYATNGGIADVHLIVATIDPTLGHRGQATFIVSTKDHPGITQGKKERKLGIRASHTAEVLLQDCFVPVENVLGGVERLEGKLERARTGQSSGRTSGALRTFEITRPLVACQAVGIARAALEFAVDYAKDRRAFGVPIAQHEGVAFQLADMAVEVDCARLLVHRAAWMAASGQTFARAEGSMSKLKAGEIAVSVTERAVQVLGGYGYIKDFPVEKWYRDAKIYTIFEGTSEIQRLVISRALTSA